MKKYYFMAYYEIEGFKGEIIYMNKDFKKRYKNIESLEKDVKESIKNKYIRNIKKVNIYKYIEEKVKEI